MVAPGPLPVAGHATVPCMLPYLLWRDVSPARLLGLLLMAVQSVAVAGTCRAHKDSCTHGWHSLLQLRVPYQHGSEPAYLQRTTLADEYGQFPDSVGNVDGILPEASGANFVRDPSLMMQMPLASNQATADQSLQAAVQGVERAERVAAADAAQATNAEVTLKGFAEKGHEAQEAQAAAMAQEELAAESVLGAMQRVQHAGRIEKQEQAAEAQASQFLQGAVESVEAMQSKETNVGVQELKAAQLLQEALRNLQVAAQDDPESETVKSLKAALQAQKAVAAAKSQKLETSALLQQSLRDAVTAVQSLKSTKEAQTSDYLEEAYKNLQGVQAAWDVRTMKEMTAAKSLEGMMNDTESAWRVAEEIRGNSSLTASLLQGVAQQVNAAQMGFSQEAAKSQSMQDSLLAQERATEANAKKSLQDAALRLEASEASRRSEAAKAEQLSHYVQTAEQESLAAQGARSMQAAQLSEMSRYVQGVMQYAKSSNAAEEAQIARLVQQLDQFGAGNKNAASSLPSAGLPSNNLLQVTQPERFPTAQVAPMPSSEQRLPGMPSPIPVMTPTTPYGDVASQLGQFTPGTESMMPPSGSFRANDLFTEASIRR